MTGYLLYTKDFLDTHRYYYRRIPELYRYTSLVAAQRVFGEFKQACQNIHYWKSDPDFWERLWEVPLADGERPSHRAQKVQWWQKLSSLLTEDERSENIHITSLTLGRFDLKPAVAKHLLKNGWMNSKGAFTKKMQHSLANEIPGNHLVIPYPGKENAEFYFKIYPEYPLVELCLNDLSRRLGYYPPRNVDIWLWKCGSYDYPVLVSEAVPGKTLQEVLEKNIFLDLDTPAFSQSVLTSLLISLEDGKPDNTVVLSEEGKMRLCLVDADRWFVSPFRGGRLHAKDIVFCLPEMMSRPVDRVLREEILSLNPEKLLKAWVTEIKEWGERCIKVFGGKITDYYGNPLTPDEEKTLLLPPLKFYAIDDLFDHLQAVQDLFFQNIQQNRPINHWQLVASVNSRLANHYKVASEKNLTPLQRFKFVAGHDYEEKSSTNRAKTEYFSTKIDFKTQMKDLWEGLPESSDIQKNWQRDIEIAESQLIGLSESPSKLDEALNHLKKGNLQRFLQLSQKGQTKLLGKIDWLQLDPKIQQDLLKTMTNEGHWQQLTINNSPALTDDRLGALLQKSPHLKMLSLKNCPHLLGTFFSQLPKTDCTLTHLKLYHLVDLNYIGYQAGTLYGEFCLFLPNLQSFSVKNCSNLLEIHVNAQLLKKLTISIAPRLKVLHIQSEQLENLYWDHVEALPLSEWKFVINELAAYQLKEVQCKETSAPEISFLLEHLPVLIVFPWENYAPELRIQYARYCNQQWEAKPASYLTLSIEKKRQLLIKTKVLLDSCQIDFNQMQEIHEILIPLFLKALKDKEWSVCQVAINGLVQLGRKSPTVMERLFKKLEDSDVVYQAVVAIALNRLSQIIPQNHIEGFLKSLGDKKWYVRRAAVVALGGLNQFSASIVGVLFEALKDNYEHDVYLRYRYRYPIRQAAIDALAQLKQKNPVVIEKLLEILNSKENDFYFRGAAARALCQNKQITPLIIDTLLRLLVDEKEEMRITAMGAVRKLGEKNPVVIEKLLEILNSKENDFYFREAAVCVLSQIKQVTITPLIIDTLLHLLGDEKEEMRITAIRALAKLGEKNPVVIEVFLKTLEDEKWVVYQTVQDDGRDQIKATHLLVEAFFKVMNDPNYGVWEASMTMLGQIKEATAPAIDILLKALENKNTGIQKSAMRALVQMGQKIPQNSIDALLKDLEHKDWYIQQEAVSELMELGQMIPQSYIDTLLKFLEDKESDPLGILMSIGYIIPQSYIDTLLEDLKNKKWRVRATAVRILGQFQQQTTIPIIEALFKALKDTYGRLGGSMPSYYYPVREAAEEALVRLGQKTPIVIDKLLETLGKGEKDIRQVTVHILWQIKQETIPIIEALLKALMDESKSVREAAAYTLKEVNQPNNPVIKALLATGVPTQFAQENLLIVNALLKDFRDSISDSHTVPKLGSRLEQTIIPTIIKIFTKVLEGEKKSINESTVRALESLSQLLSEKIAQRFEDYIKEVSAILNEHPKLTENHPTKLSNINAVKSTIYSNSSYQPWGTFFQRDIAAYAFRFFDTRTLKSAGCASHACRDLQKAIEAERMEFKYL